MSFVPHPNMCQPRAPNLCSHALQSAVSVTRNLVPDVTGRTVLHVCLLEALLHLVDIPAPQLLLYCKHTMLHAQDGFGSAQIA